ncbi:hypothetical protein BGZ60DRAFT_550991 [Tricladium varicosporioides]|nr:hypothetical protein BGZ60DRAFT_550991 [Hymenoscyphus varicosporioides]
MGADQYPEVQSTIPSSRTKETITTRILRPGVVVLTVVVLMAMSLTGIAVAGGILGMKERHSMSVIVAQGFVVAASVFSISYGIVHGVCAKYNDPVGVVRPPVLKSHAACFILARIVLVLWILAMILSCVAVSRPTVCKIGNGFDGADCRPEVIGVVISNIAFLTAGIILTALEACQYPFQLPEVFHMAKKMTYRVSTFGTDILERSISRASSFNDENTWLDKKRPVRHNSRDRIAQKPLPRLPALPAEDTPERPLTPLLQMAQRSNSKGWGKEWTHSSREGKRHSRERKRYSRDSKAKGMTKSDSAVSGLSGMSRSSSGYISSSTDRSSDSSPPRRQRPRVVTPSSSISNLTKRSPLSSMRSAEYPDVLVRPELRYCPPTIPAPHEWRLSRTASLTQLLPAADVQYLQRRASYASVHNQYMIRGPGRNLPPLAHHRRMSPAPSLRRRSSEIRIPGPYLDYRLSMDAERNLEEHARKIEAISISRSETGRELKPRPPPKDPVSVEKRKPVRKVERRESPREVERKSSYRESQPLPRGLQRTTGEKDVRPHTSKEMRVSKTELQPSEFRRLSLGDISSGFGKLFDV